LAGFFAFFFMARAPKTGSPPFLRMRRYGRLGRGVALFMGQHTCFRT
jgi:hypothetical protein